MYLEPSIGKRPYSLSSIKLSEAIPESAPVSLSLPYIIGDPVIPNTLRVHEGKWSANPSPVFTYRWLSSGHVIPGLTEPTLTLTEDYEGYRLGCEVVATNRLGSALVATDPHEPDRVTQTEPTNRMDVRDYELYLVSGLGVEGKQNIFSNEIAVVDMETGRVLEPGTRQKLPLKNAQAELGLLGWLSTGGISVSHISFQGQKSFMGGLSVHPSGINKPHTYITQSVPLWPIWLPTIDEGLCFIDVDWHQYLAAGTGQDSANIKLDFFNEAGVRIGGNTGPGLWASPGDTWFERKIEGASIPKLTRSINFTYEFYWGGDIDNDSNAIIDGVRSYIREGMLPGPRVIGPTYKQWRIRFTENGNLPGCALSEVDMGNPSPGIPIFGSVGWGVTNADAAFDGKVDHGYWAGAPDSVEEGTCWIGYKLTTNWRPFTVALTARLSYEPTGSAYPPDWPPNVLAWQMGRAFDLEGSEDGVNWELVERYDLLRVGRPWLPDEKRTFTVHAGAFPYSMGEGWFKQTHPGRAKGMIFKSLTRFNLTHLRFKTKDRTFSCLWQIARISNKESSIGYYGVVSDPGFTGIHNAVTGEPTKDEFNVVGDVWQEIELPVSFEVNVDDQFLVTMIAPTGSNYLNEIIGGGWDDHDGYQTNTQGAIRKVTSWVMDRTTKYDTGDLNEGPQPPLHDRNYAIDFKGNFY